MPPRPVGPVILCVVLGLLGSITAAAAAPITWTGTVDGSWHTPGNWDLMRVPDAGDEVVIPDLPGTASVIYDSGTTSIQSLTCGEVFVLSGGALDIAGASTIGNTFTLSGASTLLTGAGDLAIGGNFTWAGGTLSGGGTTTIGSASVWTVSGPSAVLTRLLHNEGQGSHLGSTVTINTPGMLRNRPGGTFVLPSDGTAFSGTGSIQVQTGALLKRDTGTGTCVLSCSVVNAGTIRGETGTLQFAGGLTNGGTLENTPGNVLLLTNPGLYSLTASTVAAAGQIRFSGGNSLIDSSVNLTITGTLSIGGTGTLSLARDLSVPALVMDGGTLNGTGHLTVTAACSYTGGTMSGSGLTTIPAGVSWTLGSNGVTTLSRTLENSGTCTGVGGTSLTVISPGVFINRSGGVVDMQSTTIFAGTGQVRNQAGATIRRTSGAGSGSISCPLVNDGLLRVETGSVRVAAALTNNGTIENLSGSLLRVSAALTSISGSTMNLGGNLTFDMATSTITVGANLVANGTLTVTTATVNLEADCAPAALMLATGAVLQGAGDVTVGSTFDWSGGTMGGSGATTVLAGALWTQGAGPGTTLARQLVNEGTCNYTGSSNTTISASGSVRNASGAVLDLRSDAAFVGNAGAIENLAGGLVRRTTSPGRVTVSSPILNAGELRVETGILRFSASLTNTSGSLVRGLAGADVEFHTGTHSFGAGSMLQVDDDLVFLNGVTTLDPAAGVAVADSFLVNGPSVSLTLGPDATVSRFVLKAGALGGPGNLTVDTAFDWTAGTMSGAGSTRIGPAAVGAILTGANAPVLGRALLNDGTCSLDGLASLSLQAGGIIRNRAGATFSLLGDNGLAGSGGFENQAGALLVKSGTEGNSVFSGAFTNLGTLRVLTGKVQLSGTFTNLSGSTLSGGAYDLTTPLVIDGASVATLDATLVLNAPTATIENELEAEVLGLLSSVGAAGSLVVRGRDLTVTGLFTNDGTVEIGDGAGAPESFEAQGGYRQNGGFTRLASGTLTGGPALAPTFVEILGGSVTGNGRLNGLVTNSSAFAPGDSTGGIVIGGDYVQTAAGRLEAELGGAATPGVDFDRLQVTGNATLDGELAVSLTGGFQPALDDSFDVVSTVSGLVAGAFATTNLPMLVGAGCLQLQYGPNAARLRVSACGPGLITWTGGAGTTSWHDSGNWSLHRAPISGDLVRIPDLPGTPVVIHSNGTTSIQSLECDEDLTVDGGVLDVASASTIAGALTFSGGTISGPGDLALSGNFEWSGSAAMAGPGTTTIDSTGNWTVPAGATPQAGRTLVLRGSGQNDGTLVVPAGLEFRLAGGSFQSGAGSSLTIGGTLDIQGDTGIGGDGELIVLPGGRLAKSAGAGTSGIGGSVLAFGTVAVDTGTLSFTAPGPFSNQGTLAIGPGATLTAQSGYVQSAGITLLTGGTLVAAAGVTIQGGSLQGSGTVAGNLVNGALLAPGVSAGAIAITGDFTQTASGQLNETLGGRSPGSEFDVLLVSGAALVDGSLVVDLAGGFVPSAQDTFDILAAGSVSGRFASANLPIEGGSFCLDLEYRPATLRLSTLGITIVRQPEAVVACPQGAALFTVSASGPGMLAYQWRRNAVVIPGATDDTLLVSPATAGDAGAYDVVIVTACDSTASLAVSLSIGFCPDTLFVDATRPPGGNGAAWATAFRDLQAALSAAAASGGFCDVWVARGRYRPDPSAQGVSFNLLSKVALYGGFAGTETLREQRNPAVNRTVLSGDLAGNDGPNFANNAENSRSVVRATGVDSTAVLDGFVVTGGNALANGAGIAVSTNARAVFRNCAIDSNFAANSGAGLRSDNSSPRLVDCTFRGNRASGSGGGMSASGTGAVTLAGGSFIANTTTGSGGAISLSTTVSISGTQFRDNSAQSIGGAVNLSAFATSMLALSDCAFATNRTTSTGGGIGGAIGVGASASLTALRCGFTGNSCTQTGSGTPNTKGGAIGNLGATMVLTECEFTDNSVRFSGTSSANACGGGAAFGPAVLDRCTFVRNETAGAGTAVRGGALHTTTGVLDIRNCRFVGNLASVPAATPGGAVAVTGATRFAAANCLFDGNTAAGDGGAIFFDGTRRGTIVECTVFGNTATLGAGGGLRVGATASGDSVALSSSILWMNVASGASGESAQISAAGAIPPRVNHCDVLGLTGALGGVGNVGGDPLFTDANGPDDIPGTPDDDFTLRMGSPVVDAGDNASIPAGVATDLAGAPRQLDDPCTVDTGAGSAPIVDLGAYEFQHTSCALDASDPALAVGVTFVGVPAPNPTTGPADIRMRLARDASVRVEVMDVAGRRIHTLLDAFVPAGEHVVRWDGRGDAGQRARPGLYFVRFRIGPERLTRRVLLRP